MIDISKDLLASIDPMKKINEDMQRVLNPMHDIQKSLDVATASIIDTSFSHNSLTDIGEQMKAFANPLHDFEKQLEYMYDPMKEINDQMDSMLNPFQDIQKQMDALYSFSMPDLSYMDAITNSAKAFQESLNAVMGKPSIQERMNTLAESYNTYKKISELSSLNNLQNTALNTLLKSITDREDEANAYVSSIESIEVISESVLLQEITEIKESILEAKSSGNVKIEEYLFNLNEYILTQKNPRLLLLFQTVLLPIILTLISNVAYDFAIKPSLEDMNAETKQVMIKKEIVQQVKEYIPNPRVRVDYRIVKADALNVREGKSRNSKIISSLTFGEVVEIIRKEKNWCLIKRYNPESETYIQGWVFTTYLAQIR